MRPTGVIVLQNAMVYSNPKRPLGLVISGPELPRDYELVCETEQEYNVWLEGLQTNILYMDRRVKTSTSPSSSGEGHTSKRLSKTFEQRLKELADSSFSFRWYENRANSPEDGKQHQRFIPNE